jgi:hypothetical protein
VQLSSWRRSCWATTSGEWLTPRRDVRLRAQNPLHESNFSRDLELMRGNTVVALERRDQLDEQRAKSVLRLHYSQCGVLAIAADRDTLGVSRELELPLAGLRIVDVLRDDADELVLRFDDGSDLVVAGQDLELSDQDQMH